MKNFYYVLFFLIIITPRLAAQNTVERYNELMNRYEYFNSSNNMIGYKTYNKLRAQWEYYSLEQKNQQQEYTYNQPYNANLINQALSQKQNNYNYNSKKIQEAIEDIDDSFYEYENYDAMHGDFGNILKTLREKRYDFSSNDMTRKVINYMYESASVIIRRNSVVQNNYKSTPSQVNSTNSNTTSNANRAIYSNGPHKVLDNTPIYEKPNLNSKIIGRTKNNLLFIFEKVSDDFYKIESGGINGYVHFSKIK